MEPKGIDDPYNHGAYLGLERAVRELGIRGRVLTPAPKEGYVPSLSLLARQKYDLVLGIGVFAAPAIDRVATAFPETRFAIIDAAHDELSDRPKNVLGLAFSAEQAGYLAGHLAALVLTLSPGEEVVSSVGGEQIAGVERWIAGYQAGARGANPRVTTLNGYTDDFLDPVKGRSVALSQIAKGSRVVFQVAAACGLGVSGGGKRARNLGDRRRCRPIAPGPAHTDERAGEVRRGRVRHDRGARSWDARDRSHVPLLP